MAHTLSPPLHRLFPPLNHHFALLSSLQAMEYGSFFFLIILFENERQQKRQLRKQTAIAAERTPRLTQNAAHGAIIGWTDNKTAIEVVDVSRMESEILPLYFRQTKFESFVRQLNLYGFRKVKAQQALKFTHPRLQQGLE
jgi:hypothetical protein